MSYSNLYKSGKVGIRLVWLILLLLLIHKLIPIVPHSWNLMMKGIINLWIIIKQRPCIYLILNFIIISLLLSSSSLTHKLTNFLHKLHKTSSHNNFAISSLISHASQQISLPFEDDTWWAHIVSHEAAAHEEQQQEDEDFTTTLHETTSFEEHHAECNDSKVVEEEEEEEVVVETLDETWKAIMEAKKKGGGPQLKKSETWSSGHGGGGDGKVTYHDELKRRADAFIARVNREIRLQRMESHQRFLDAINRGL